MQHDLGAHVAQVEVAPEAGEPVSRTGPDRHSASRTLPSGTDEEGVRRIVSGVRPNPEPSAAKPATELCVRSPKCGQKSPVLDGADPTVAARAPVKNQRDFICIATQ